jgi:hypothetical protein
VLLRSLADAAPECARVVRQETRVDGYIFGRRGSHADHLGPRVARSKDVAELLLVEFLLQSNRELVFVDCLSRNPGRYLFCAPITSCSPSLRRECFVEQMAFREGRSCFLQSLAPNSDEDTVRPAVGGWILNGDIEEERATQQTKDISCDIERNIEFAGDRRV